MDIITPSRPNRVLVIAAHPDDLEFNMAGTSAKWANDGTEMIYVLCTAGEAGSHDLNLPPEKLAPIRQNEQKCAAKKLGVKDVIFLSYPDGVMENTLTLRKDITRLIRQFQPEAVFTWDPSQRYSGTGYINHPDHIVVGEACLAALMPTCDSPFLFPELLSEGFSPYKVPEVYLFGAQEANVWIDITETIDKKIDAIKCHESQFQDWDGIEQYVRASAESSGKDKGIPYAEAFRYFHLTE
jgi:LmbE family N-acetylglucosaminyl deacetylase